jgi:hypothetical protein
VWETGARALGVSHFRIEYMVPDSCMCDDPALALTLISTWSLLTGRRLRTVDRTKLNVDELIDFWADPRM